MSIAKKIEFKTEYLKVDIAFEDMLQHAEIPECNCYAVLLKQVYRNNTEKDDVRASYAQFLSILCEFHFKEENNKYLLSSYLNYNNEKLEMSDIIDDFDIEVVKKIIESTNNQELLARLYDILWSAKKDYRLVTKTLEYYLNSIKVLNNYSWIYPLERFKRFIFLGKLTNNRKLEVSCIKIMIDEAENNVNQKDSFFSISLAECLANNGLIEPYYKRLLEICESKAQFLIQQHDYYKASRYYEDLAKICHSIEDYTNKKKYKALYAETNILEGNDAIEKENSFFKASHFYSIAAESYKQIGNNTKYNELHLKLLDYQKKGLAEFKSTPYDIDVTSSINAFNSIFKELDFFNSVIKLSVFLKSPTHERIKQYIEDQKQYVFKQLFPGARVNEQGKVIAIGTSADLNYEKYSKQIAYEYLGYHWTISYHSLIQVFLRHISLTPFGKKDIEKLVWLNPFIDPNRVQYFIDGLYEGFCFNFSASIHILVPQVENMFRFILINHDIVPTKLIEGIQEELDINEILMRDLYRTILEQVFGKDMILDIEALLIGKLGMNLRNKLAHGLLSYDDSFTCPAIYFFCIVLKIVVLGWVNNKQEIAISDIKSEGGFI